MSEPTEPRTKPRRPKGQSPTSRTLAECKKRGWPVGVVERYIAPIHKRVDLFGVIDLIAITPTGILGIQATGAQSSTAGRGGIHAAHRTKILAEPRARAWILAGGQLELWTWHKRGDAGKRKLWSARIEKIFASDFSGAEDFG